jgi:hypothetical protein
VPDHGVEIGEGRLRAGVEAAAARGDREAADEDAEVEPAGDLEILVEGEDHADGGAKELVVAAALFFRALEVALPDAH